jgi:hypothetical protein
LTIKSSVTSHKTTPSRKNGETRHTLLSREPVSIPIEHVTAVNNTQSTDPDVLELYDKAASSVHINTDVTNTHDRRHRSRTLEAHQIQAVDNQIYGCPSKPKQQTHQRSESHKHRTHRVSFRRSSEDTQDKQSKLKGNNGSIQNETWFDIRQDHWTNLLENGWRPTVDTPGVTPVSIADSGKNYLSYLDRISLLIY